MLLARIVFAVAGLGLLLYGGYSLLTHVPPALLVWLVVWLVAVLLAHDLVLAPGVVGLGWVIGERVPAGGRRYLQAGLVVTAMVTVIALPLMLRQGSRPPAKAMLLQNYALNWLLLVLAIAGVLVVAYLVRRSRHGRGTY
jgi:hypothetical protein